MTTQITSFLYDAQMILQSHKVEMSLSPLKKRKTSTANVTITMSHSLCVISYMASNNKLLLSL